MGVVASDLLKAAIESPLPIVCAVCEKEHKGAGVVLTEVPPVVLVISGELRGSCTRVFCDTDECAPFNRRGWKPKN